VTTSVDLTDGTAALAGVQSGYIITTWPSAVAVPSVRSIDVVTKDPGASLQLPTDSTRPSCGCHSCH